MIEADVIEADVIEADVIEADVIEADVRRSGHFQKTSVFSCRIVSAHPDTTTALHTAPFQPW